MNDKNKSGNKYYKQHTRIPFGLYRNTELYLILNKCLPIYTYLQTCIFRKIHGKDKFDLYNKYYMKGILAVSIPKSKIAKMHGHGPNKTREILGLLEEYGFIKKKKIQTKYKKKGKWVTGQQNVFILGTHFMNSPKYLADDINFSKVVVNKG